VKKPEEIFVTGPAVILTLKIAVIAVTVLLLASLVALARGQYRLHGRINLAFFTLTLIAVLGLEVFSRFVSPGVFAYIYENQDLRRRMITHLCFSIPSLVLMPAMLYTGLKGHRSVHLLLAMVFGVLWTGTFVTGVFFLPHN
jgi:uncharacterized membrane protein YozB (DUF420 family)